MHKIFHLILEDLGKVRKSEDGNFYYSEKDRYTHNCYNGEGLIRTAQEKLDLALKTILLSHSHVPIDNTYTQGEYIEFMIEGYITRSIAIYDRALIFTSCLADTGISREKVEHELIMTNQKVIETGVINNLKKLRKVSATYRVDRNKIIHHDKYENKDLEKLITVHQAQRIIDIEEVLGITNSELISVTARIILEKYNEFEEHKKNIDFELNNFLDISAEYYVKHRENLSDRIVATNL